MKFLLDRPISEAPTSFFNASQGQAHPVARRLFAVPGVSSLLLLGDFVTVNKRPDVPWPGITREVVKALAEV